jgi:hypothetical protein
MAYRGPVLLPSRVVVPQPVRYIFTSTDKCTSGDNKRALSWPTCEHRSVACAAHHQAEPAGLETIAMQTERDLQIVSIVFCKAIAVYHVCARSMVAK